MKFKTFAVMLGVSLTLSLTACEQFYERQAYEQSLKESMARDRRLADIDHAKQAAIGYECQSHYFEIQYAEPELVTKLHDQYHCPEGYPPPYVAPPIHEDHCNLDCALQGAIDTMYDTNAYFDLHGY